MKLSELLDLIKKHGLPMVACAFVFVQLNWRVSTVEKKYEDCVDARINEAFRLPRHTEDKTLQEPTKMFAILTEPIRIKRNEKN
jgi:hypothetical protein